MAENKKVTEKAPAKETAKTKRVRRVSVDVQSPKEGEVTASISLNVAGHAEPLVYPVDFSTIDKNFLQQAALAGMVTRLSIAYGGETEAAKIVEAITKEFKNFDEKKFISRATSVKKLNAPDVVLAWMAVMGANPENQEELAKYCESWANRNDEDKEKVSKNRKVIVELERIQAERRLAKKQKEAIADDSALEL